MAGSVNKVTLIGRLGKDPEVRYTSTSQPVCRFSMATDESWTDKSGAKQERTEWHNIVVWGKLAEICGEHLQKGRQAYIEGKLQTRDWQGKDGQSRRSTEVVAREVVFIGNKGGQDRPKEKPVDDQYANPPRQEDEDDIPF